MTVYILTGHKLGLTPLRKWHLRKQKLFEAKRSIKIVAKMMCTRIPAMLMDSKVGCVFPMIVVSLLLHADYGRNDHRENAFHFINEIRQKSHHNRDLFRCTFDWLTPSNYRNSSRFWKDFCLISFTDGWAVDWQLWPWFIYSN